MRQLGEQWVEEVDGVQHMVGKVACKKDMPCHGCAFGYFDMTIEHTRIHTCTCTFHCDDDGTYVYKDLDPVNKDGLLACSFCKEFPKGVSKGTEYKNDCEISIFYIEHSCKVIQTTEFAYSEQEAIDAWNRRA